MRVLTKFQETKIRRDHGGRFTAFEQRWTDAKGGRAWNIGKSAVPNTGSPPVGGFALGSKLPGIPEEYTGSKELSAPVGSFSTLSVQHQVPKAHGLKLHNSLFRSLVTLAQGVREAAIVKATETGKIPEGTPRGLVTRAYNHAALLALHDFHVIDYDFKMDDDLKADIAPLAPFMRYARRRIIDKFRGTHKGAYLPYRAEFGHRFPTPKTIRGTNQERLRPRPNQELIKVGSFATDEELAKFLPFLAAAAEAAPAIAEGAAAVGRFAGAAYNGAKSMFSAGSAAVDAASAGARAFGGRAASAVGNAGARVGARVASATEGTTVGRAGASIGSAGRAAGGAINRTKFAQSIAGARKTFGTMHTALNPGQTLGRALGAQVSGARAAKVGAFAGTAADYVVAPETIAAYHAGKAVGSGLKPPRMPRVAGAPPSLGKALGMPAGQTNPNVLPAQPGVSHWDRYRMDIARNESQGMGGQKVLTFAQKQERVRAARLGAIKQKSGGMRILAGQPGSIAHDGISHRDYGAYAARGMGMPSMPQMGMPALGKSSRSEGKDRGLVRHGARIGKGAPAAHPAAINATPDHLRHLIEDPEGRHATQRHLDAIMPPDVQGIMGEMHDVISKHRHKVPTPETRARSRHDRSDAIADHGVPLHAVIRG